MRLSLLPVRLQRACLWGLGVGVLGVGLAQPMAAAGRLVTFGALDGRRMTGLFVEANARPAPAVVLVPMLGRAKEDWEAVAQRLADAGIHALAIDARAPDEQQKPGP